MPFGSSTPTRSPRRKPAARNALPSRFVSASNSRKLTVRESSTTHCASPYCSAARRISDPICIDTCGWSSWEPLLEVIMLASEFRSRVERAIGAARAGKLVAARIIVVVLDPSLAQKPEVVRADARCERLGAPIVLLECQHALRREVAVDLRVEVRSTAFDAARGRDEVVAGKNGIG